MNLDKLTRTLDEEQTKMIRANYKEALVFRKRLVEVLNEEIEKIRKNSVNKNKYDKPHWALEQADAVGEERAYRRLIELFSEKI